MSLTTQSASDPVVAAHRWATTFPATVTSSPSGAVGRVCPSGPPGPPGPPGAPGSRWLERQLAPVAQIQVTAPGFGRGPVVEAAPLARPRVEHGRFGELAVSLSLEPVGEPFALKLSI